MTRIPAILGAAAALCLGAGLSAVLPDRAGAQSCSEIRFARGASSGEVSGRVAEGEALCYSFGTGSGQTARLQLFGSRNTCFAVLGVVDCQEDFSFRTQAGTYEVYVAPLFRTATYETFTLRLTIN
ncbi:hypothetical protein [Roseivivax isoporae]|uniref:Uncharacterized protein n=1 Tax=Roseivivax isoporae LMG 25204 TaxID=1449351 RepID=X7F991_9RHOB|nr:hypothetical protein [Roseivivax isoporae]ETX29293.1 hypothetical protein RISW2_02170 [Roseivivax isoporae LMG 25204]